MPSIFVAGRLRKYAITNPTTNGVRIEPTFARIPTKYAKLSKNLYTIIIASMGITHFTGSKILYVIFIDENNKANHYLHSTLSKNICAVKNMVSFGVENFNGLNETEFADENAILKAKYLGSFIRDSIPLCNIGENEYPFRCFNQSTF